MRVLIWTSLVALALGCVLPGGAAYAKDLYLEARLAALDGDFAKCAKISDRARKTDGATWHSHQVHATCIALDAQTNKDKLTPEQYEQRIMTAVKVLENLRAGPLIPMDKHRSQVGFKAMELRKMLERDLAEMRGETN